MAATVLTNSLPVMELLFREGGPELEVIGIGGNLRRLTRSFVGPFAVRTVQGHFADRLFFSVKGIAANGMLTDADPLEAELKRTMIEQAGDTVLLIDHSKLEVRGLSVIAPIARRRRPIVVDRPRRRRGRRAAARRDDGPDDLVALEDEVAASTPERLRNHVRLGLGIATLGSCAGVGDTGSAGGIRPSTRSSRGGRFGPLPKSVRSTSASPRPSPFQSPAEATPVPAKSSGRTPLIA